MAYKNTKRGIKKKERQKRLLVSFVVFLILLFISFFVLMRMDWIQNKVITIEGNSFVTETAIRDVAKESMRGNSFFVLPKTNTFFLNKKAIRDSVISSFPEIHDVALDRKGVSELHMIISERAEEYLLCQKELCYSFDANGYVFKKALKTLSEVDYYFTSNKDYKISENLFNTNIITEIDILVTSLKKKGLDIQKVHEQSEFTNVLVTKQGTRILIPALDSYDEIYSILVKLTNTQDFLLDKEENDFKSNFAYVNVQFGKKIFSCLQGEECENNYR